MIRLHTYAVLPPTPAGDSQTVDTEEGHFCHHGAVDEAVEYYQSQSAGNIDTNLQHRLDNCFESLDWANCFVAVQRPAPPTFLLLGVLVTFANESG